MILRLQTKLRQLLHPISEIRPDRVRIMTFERTLYYATNRRPMTDAFQTSSQRFYGPYRSATVSFGTYSMNNGDVQPGQLPDIESIPITAESKVLIFVHGFNSQFDSYLKIFANLVSAIEEVETVDENRIYLLYSWPSMGSPFAYMQDECSVQFSYPQFRRVMESIQARLTRRDQVSFVAHSLGCQLVYRYLMEIDSNGGASKVADSVVFSCPDLDYQTVTLDSEREALSHAISRGYILVSDIDVPLEISRALHGYTRLGRPSMSTPKSLFWGAFRTGSIENIVGTFVHAPEIIARYAVKSALLGFRNPDEAWKEENQDKAITFADNVNLFDFTLVDQQSQDLGHSLSLELIASLLQKDRLPEV